MPIYPVECQNCHFIGDVFCKVAELDHSGRVLCPECGARAEQVYAKKCVQNGNRRFHGDGQESITEGWHKDEVVKVQREMASSGHTEAANCIDKDGTVRFKDRAQQQDYMKAKSKIWQKVASS